MPYFTFCLNLITSCFTPIHKICRNMSCFTDFLLSPLFLYQLAELRQGILKKVATAAIIFSFIYLSSPFLISFLISTFQLQPQSCLHGNHLPTPTSNIWRKDLFDERFDDLSLSPAPLERFLSCARVIELKFQNQGTGWLYCPA